MAFGVVLAPLGLFVRARRWRYLFAPDAVPPGLVPAIMIGYMANNVLPLRAGELVRVYVVARRWGHGFWTVLATLVVERVLDSLALVAILAGLVLVVPVPRMFQWAAAVLLAIDVVGVSVLVFLALAPAYGRRLVSRLGSLVAGLVSRLAPRVSSLGSGGPRFEERLLGIYDTFVRGLDGIRTTSHLPGLVIWSVVAWIIPAAAAWAMLRAIDLTLPFTAGWAVLAFVGLGISVPSAPGYIGVFHMAAKEAVALFAVPTSAAVGYAILFHASQYVPVTLLGWVYLLREHVTLSAAAHYRESAPASATD